MLPTLTILETGPAHSELTARNVRDLAHVRRLLLQAAVSVESEGVAECNVPAAKLHLLRGFLANIGAETREYERRLLLMALLQMEDEDEARRLIDPSEVLPVLLTGR